jgi:hypothetical protein
MTLVLFVRCLDGCILASDRKATLDTGFGEEEAKCEVFPIGVAIAGAGNGELIQALFSRMRDENIIVEDIEGIVKRILKEFLQRDRRYDQDSGDSSVELIVLAARNGTVEASIVETSQYDDVISYPITSPFRCVGENAPKVVAQHYLKRLDLDDKLCVRAAPEVLAILELACREGSFVGSQEDFGLDIVLFRTNDFCQKPRVTNEWAVVSNEFHVVDGISSQFSFTQFDRGER